MNKEDIQTLFAYNAWANERILSAAAKVPEEKFAIPAHLSHGSLRTTLVHMIGAEHVWRQRAQEGVSPSTLLKEADFPTFASLRQYVMDEDQKFIDYAAGLTDAELQQVAHYKNTRSELFATPLWQILAHVVNHGTQTRSEAAIALTEYDCSPGDIDLIKYWRER
jgi:uncharacterized damage-inducible protein DinB